MGTGTTWMRKKLTGREILEEAVLEVNTVIPEDVIRDTISGEQGKRGNKHSSGFPMPLVPT